MHPKEVFTTHFLIRAVLVLCFCGVGRAAAPASATSAAQPDAAKTEVEYVQLINTSAAESARILDTMYRATTPVKSGAVAPPDRVLVSADARTNTVILTGAPERVAQAVILLQKMDGMSNDLARGTNVFFIYHVTEARATELVTLVNRTFGADPAANSPATQPERAPLGGAVYLVANPDTNSILVTADVQLERTVRDLLALLDHSDQKAAPASQAKPGLP